MFHTASNVIFILSASLVLFTACEEKKEDPSPTNTEPIYGDTVVTKTGKGFTPLAILVNSNGLGSGVGGGNYDYLTMVDMTMLPDGKTLHMALSGTTATQQDPINVLDRRVMDVETKTMLPGPTSNLGGVVYKSFTSSTTFGNRTFGYQYGTDRFFVSNTTVSNFGIVTGTITGDYSYTRSETFASDPRVTHLGEIVEDVGTQTSARLDGNSNNQIFFNYQKANGASVNYKITRIVHANNVSAVIRGGRIEAAEKNADRVLVFCLSKKHLYAAEAPVTGNNLIFLDSLELPAEWLNADVTTRRSDDGTGFGLLVGNRESNGSLSITSARYDVATKKMSQNITNLSIPKFNEGKINYDMDEQGNMYFDNWANNFQSDSTISIYKASGSAFSVVGQEDIIKSGSVVNVRYLKGKVYAAVYYKYTVSAGGNSSKKHRIAVIKQD